MADLRTDLRVDFSVAICTYNGENRIGQVLERLRSQLNTDSFTWEIIVVDNNSSDRTQSVVETYQSDWNHPFALNYQFEPEQGAAFARSRAVRKSAGAWVALLDDDTLPDENWVAQAYQFAQNHPKVGAFGGQIHGDFEVEPPADFQRIAVFLAIIERGAKPYRYEPHKRVLPPSAGLVVRRQAWLDHAPQKPVLIGRTSKLMLASEDIEVNAHLQNAGWEIWYNPDMHLYHQIPRWRLERDYLLSLMNGIGLAKYPIRMVRLQPWRRPFAVPVYWLNDLRKTILHAVKYRQTIATDLAAACEMQLLVGSLVSPFYFWRRSLTKETSS
jgi:glycosyltransferase involved in cell wall biosynthesis